MNIKNYTSSVPIERSIMLIERLLIDVGAANINKAINTKTKEVVGVVFQINVNGNPVVFKLPSKIELCYKTLLKSYSPKSAIKDSIQESCKAQAGRTAWKLLYEWVQIQCSMIQLEQIETMEVFLPYLYDVRNETTYFEQLKAGGFKKLLGPSKDAN